MTEQLLELLLSIAASVIGTYVCKWLDRHNKGG